MPRYFLYHSNPETLAFLKQTLGDHCRKIGEVPQITCFSDYAKAASWIKKMAASVDIAFLDGTDPDVLIGLVRVLRLDNLRMSWVFADGSEEVFHSSLIYRPSAYLPDARDRAMLLAAADELIRFHRLLQKRLDFTFRFEGETIHMPLDRISYFESCAKKVMLHLRDHSQIYCFSAKLDDIQKKLPDYFIRCHQSYLVNPNQISRLDSKEHLFILNDGSDVLISRRMLPAAKSDYELYLNSR